MSEPKYGNAYENTEAVSMPTPTLPHQKMPIHTDYQDTNAWQESTKTLDEVAKEPQNAYQHTGTPYGNTDNFQNAYSNQQIVPTEYDPQKVQTHKIEPPMVFGEPFTDYDEPYPRPSKLRWCLRIATFISSVGSLGFAAGASPRSGQPVPFDNVACFYYLWVVAILSILYSLYHIVFFLCRRFGRVRPTNRVTLILADLVMALIWGIGVIIEVLKYHCKPGDLNGWCNFYNTSVFFGYLSFALYIFLLGWDTFGCVCGGRGSRD